MSKKLLPFLICMLFFLSGNIAFAQKGKNMYIPWFETINLKKDFQLMGPKLLKGYIEQSNRYIVVLPSYGDTVSGAWLDLVNIQQQAKDRNADYFTLGTLTRLGETVLVDIKMYEAGSGNLIWADKLKASGPDDLDPIMQKIAEAIGTPNKAALAGDIFSVSNYETKELKKQQANYSFGASVGGLALLSGQSSQPMAGFSLVGSYDIRDFILDMRGSYYGMGSLADFYSFGLEVNKPFTKTNHSPFVGAGMLLSGYSEGFTVNGSGLMLTAGGGYIFNRTSSAQLRFSIHGVQGFYDAGPKPISGIIFKMELLFNK